MDFKQLEAFTAVVEWNSFSEAAKRICLTQPTISSHIRSLENELGISLLNRTTKCIEITEEGKYLYDEALKLLKIRNHIYEKFSQNPVSTIRLGAFTIPALYLLPDILPAFRKKYPIYHFDLWQSDSLRVIRRLQEHSLDIRLIGTKINDSNFTFLPFAKDELIIAQMNDQEMIKSFIRNGLGISIMSGFSVAEEEKNTILVFHLEKNASLQNLYIVHEKRAKLPPYIRHFIQTACNMFLGKP